MQETHHRIKNNLQTVSAILDLYLMDADRSPERSVEGLRHALREVRIIANVHDLLSADVQLGRVDMRPLEDAIPYRL